LEALDKELGRLLANPLTETEVEDAKSHLEGSLILVKDDMEVRMKRLARLHSLALDVIEYGESLAYIKRVRLQGVRDMAERIIRPGEFGLVAYGGEEIGNFEDYSFSFV
jgi:predicted Zn-dependent peptidase